MKKTISINIGGIIFHIEEDGYEKLKAYLFSIQRYFSSFADSKEILSDIESRIAERFLSKQKTENKQVISIEDVDELVTAMGTVADFEAIEQSEDILSDPLETVSSFHDAGSSSQEIPPIKETPQPNHQDHTKKKTGQKLVRDLRRKLLGGVAAGLAHNYAVDPLWIRIAFLLSFFSLPIGASIFNTAGFGFLSAFSLIVYVAMWIAFPGSTHLEEDTKIKKFYRNPDQKVVGGVAAGVASYFGADLGVVRFLWVISIFFFGTGVMAYIILWVIAPNANTLTEKMEMQGEPITLSNIESNIKQGLQLEQKGDEEHILSKILLLPFRGIAILVNVLGKLIKGMGPIFRIVTGIILVLSGASSLFALIICIAALFGFTSTMDLDSMPMPFRLFQDLPNSLIISGLVVGAIPFIAFLLLGLTLLSNRKIVGVSVWLTLLGAWIVGMLVTVMEGVSYQQNFAKRGTYTETISYKIPKNTLTLHRLEDDGYDTPVDTYINLNGYHGSDSLRLEKTMYSKGRTREIARTLASELVYDLDIQDSIFIFGGGPISKRSGTFRDQRIELTLNIPYEKTFRITGPFWSKLSKWNGNHKKLGDYALDRNDVNWQKLVWTIRQDSGLVCLNLPIEYRKTEDPNTNSINYDEHLNDHEVELGERGNFIKQFSIGDFNKVNIGGAYSITIRKGNEFSISADGEEEIIDKLKVTVDGGVLQISHPSEKDLSTLVDGKRIGLVITAPQMESILLSGANKAIVSGFENQKSLSIDLAGASKIKVQVNQIQNLDVNLSGTAHAYLTGSVHALDAHLSGVCMLNGKEMKIERANIDATGASKAYFRKINQVVKSATGVSKIETE